MLATSVAMLAFGLLLFELYRMVGDYLWPSEGPVYVAPVDFAVIGAIAFGARALLLRTWPTSGRLNPDGSLAAPRVATATSVLLAAALATLAGLWLLLTVMTNHT